jgi:hypothetical protein
MRGDTRSNQGSALLAPACSAGKPQALLDAAAKPPLRPEDAPASPDLWVEIATEMSAAWMDLLMSQLTYRPAELQVRGGFMSCIVPFLP